MHNNPFFPANLKEGGWYVINKGGIAPAQEQPECMSGYAVLQFPHISGQCTTIGVSMTADGVLLTTIVYEPNEEEDEMLTDIETTGFPSPCVLRVLQCGSKFHAELWPVDAADIVETENWNPPTSVGLGASELEQIALGLRAEATALCLPAENAIWQYATRCEALAFPPVQIVIMEHNGWENEVWRYVIDNVPQIVANTIAKNLPRTFQIEIGTSITDDFIQKTRRYEGYAPNIDKYEFKPEHLERIKKGQVDATYLKEDVLYKATGLTRIPLVIDEH